MAMPEKSVKSEAAERKAQQIPNSAMRARILRRMRALIILKKSGICGSRIARKHTRSCGVIRSLASRLSVSRAFWIISGVIAAL